MNYDTLFIKKSNRFLQRYEENCEKCPLAMLKNRSIKFLNTDPKADDFLPTKDTSMIEFS